MVMRKYQNRFAVGLFTGVVVMMALNMFSLMVLFAGSASSARADAEGNGDVHSDEAAATFSFFMFFLYAIFFGVLVKHRNVIIKENAEDMDDATTNELDKTTASAPSSAPVTTLQSAAPVAAAPPVSV